MIRKQLKYSSLVLLFIEKNKTVPRYELALLVNNKFGTSYTTANIKSLCTRNGWKTGRTGCFEKGNIPSPNARPRGPSKTSFKKGDIPANYKRVGTERINTEGYREIKIAEGKSKWRLKQRLVWNAHHKTQLSANQVIRFIDSDKLNCDISNLEVFTRGENVLLNQMGVYHLPEALKPIAKNICRIQARVHKLYKEIP